MYINRKIARKDLKDYENVIPPTYMEQLRANKFYAGEILDVVDGKEAEEAIFITYFIDGWLELVWVSYINSDMLPIVRANLLRYLVMSEKQRYGDRLKGAFFETHIEELKDQDQFRQSLIMCGFEAKETVDNIYELSLDQVKENEQKFLAKAAKMMKCITVSSADDDLKDKIDQMMQEDSRPVPIGMYVNWSDFSAEDSLICMKDDNVCGVLLLSKNSDYIVMDCAYVTDKMALSSMVGWAYFRLMKKYGPTQKMLIPAVLEKTGMIVEKIAPEAMRGKMIEGIMHF